RVAVGDRDRCGEPLLLHLGELAEDLLLGVEVVIEGAMRELGPFGDVGDAGREETVLFEDLLGRGEKPRPGPLPLARTRRVGRRIGRHGRKCTGGGCEREGGGAQFSTKQPRNWSHTWKTASASSCIWSCRTTRSTTTPVIACRQ